MNDIAEPTPSVYVLFSVERSEETAVAVCESMDQAKQVAAANEPDKNARLAAFRWDYREADISPNDWMVDGEDDPDTGAWWSGWRIRKVELGVPFA